MRASQLLTGGLRAVEQPGGNLPAAAAVHQARVSARKLRAALRILGARELDRGVKDLQDALGDVRDLQLQVAWLRGRDAALFRAHRAQLRKAERGLDAALRKWRSRTVPALLEASVNARAPSPRKLSKLLRKRLDRLEERLERARAKLSPTMLHRARISVKQVRYLLQVAKGALPRKALRLDADLKSLQASLGELHDADLRIGLVKDRPRLQRDQRDARERLAKVVEAQLARWKKQKVAARARKLL
jgi:CHAD domain-containing protein